MKDWLDEFIYWTVLLPSKIAFWMAVVMHPEKEIIIDNTPSMWGLSDWFIKWCEQTGIKYTLVCNPFLLLKLENCIFVSDGCYFMVELKGTEIIMNVLKPFSRSIK